MTTRPDIREKQLRDRVRAARNVANLAGERDDGAAMYAQDVEPMRRLLADICVKRAAVALGGDKQIVADAIIKAQKWLGGKPR